MENQKEQTITYGFGRFVINIPSSMQYRGGTYNMRFCDLVEITCDSEQEIETAWKVRLNEIDKLEPPKNHSKSIIDTSEFSRIKGVFYYGDKWMPDTGYWDILVERKTSGLWIKLSGDYENEDIENKNKMWKFASNIAKAYRPPTESTGKAEVIKGRDSFYLRYGAVDLPFEYKEHARIYFEGHSLDQHTTLEIESDVVHDVETVGLIDRFKAAFSSGYAQGLKAKKIRAKERVVAGEKGEEYIYLGTDEDDGTKELSFLWEFPGQADSGNHPELSVTMMCEDGHLKEKLALWDAILDSMRPAAK